MTVCLFFPEGFDPPKTCRSPSGQVYMEGQTFQAADGCNVCWCRNERIECSAMDCKIYLSINISICLCMFVYFFLCLTVILSLTLSRSYFTYSSYFVKISIYIYLPVQFLIWTSVWGFVLFLWYIGERVRIGRPELNFLKWGIKTMSLSGWKNRIQEKYHQPHDSTFSTFLACTPGSPTTCLGPGGQVYKEGQSFPASDGCNTCVCTNGMVACTEIRCKPDWLS